MSLSPSTLFDIYSQFAFYGAYHTNRINILIHIICVPLILCALFQLSNECSKTDDLSGSAQAMASHVLVFPVHHTFSDYLVFDFNFPALAAAAYFAYYFALEPVAALLYAPLMVLSVLTATAFARSPSYMTQAAILHAACWIAQFLGHGLAEKRSPALLDNILGAVVLAPFFVHLEILFALGYRPEMHKRLTNEIGKEIAKMGKVQGDRRRGPATKAI
ncbi:hypothetical protein GGX14DRAFT_616000 [Mycena pura]|uniref:DUF962-domain-containing protein n=1 Tax=Mycena pura TaxID=153505 RepID=A0AAD6YTP9_9AGAR|nr:hypothetical protein GGX14DRAFT_616000 [Mycena pura]